MVKKMIPLALAVVMAGALAGCPGNDRGTEGGGGGGMTQTERGGDQLTFDWGRGMSGEERNFAEAYTRATWVQANLIAGDWEQAKKDLDHVRDNLQDLAEHTAVPAAVRKEIATLMPKVTNLYAQIDKHDKASLKSASTLVNSFNQIASTPSVMAWMGGPAGGGAGTAPMNK